MSKHKPRELIVRAHYEDAIDDQREQRIREALERCRVRGYPPQEVVIGRFLLRQQSDVVWNRSADGTEHDLKVRLLRGRTVQERAQRLADELRDCGLVVSVEPLSDEEREQLFT
jgi:hypothetical protein